MDISTTSMELSSLQELLSSNSLAKLEKGVDAGLQVLADVKASFANAKSVPEIGQWITSLEKLKSGAGTQRTVVGVVGSTGAGKSSVINAVLDEECLVPTSCMRACTAVITEIAYNNCDRDGEKYRAEIHFINSDEWTKELSTMTDDMQAGPVPSGTQSSESDASIAYQKIRAVYPSLKSEEIKSGELVVGKLTQEPSVQDVLGTVKRITCPTSKEFLDLLKTFIDSKEKTRGRKKEADIMEYWPLIKVVKIFVRSPILESGLVLVDLPGIHDSNAARSAVASRYIEQCSGLWVVAPITRAVDDRAAQTLLDTSFKRQLQFDGTYSRITVICSKADDLSVTEAVKVLPEGETAHQHHEHSILLEAEGKKVQEAITELEAKIAGNKMAQDCQFDAMDSLRAAIRRSGDDEDLLLLVSPGSARKRHTRTAASEARKRMKRANSFDADDSDSDQDEDSLTSETESDDEQKEQVSKEVAQKRLEDIEALNAVLRSECKELELRLKPLHKNLKEIKGEIKSLKSQAKRGCIRFRNEYARPEIQAQFAEGIREMDQDNAAQDEEQFDPTHVGRDYAEIAKKLPVFCVSSRAYQKMSGRLERDESIPGFTNLEDTEIPGLQRHAISAVHETRAATCRRFLRDLGHFLNSLYLQVVLSDQPLRLADNLREKELQSLGHNVDELRGALFSAIDEAFAQCREMMDTHIFQKFTTAVSLAADAAPSTVDSWICHKDDGGLSYQTFRATCVREGAFKGAKGYMDFNTALTEPITKHVARLWEYIFSSYIPDRLDILAVALGNLLSSFQMRMGRRSQLQTAPSFALITSQVKILKDSLSDTADLKALVHTRQKEASRLMVPVVGEVMADAYTQCVGEFGPGCYKRAKEHLKLHIERVRNTMFRAATQKVKRSLSSAVDELESEVGQKVDHVVALIDKDYKALLADGNIFKALSTARDELRDLLATVGGRFEIVLHTPIKVEDVNPSEQMAAITAAVDLELPVTSHTNNSQLPLPMGIDGNGAPARTHGEGTLAEV